MRIGLICSLTGVLAIWTATVAQGTELTFVMEGTVQYLTDPSTLLPAAQVGQRVVYTYSFDSDTPDTNSTQSYGIYQGLSASLRVGTMEIPAEAPRIEVNHPDSYQVWSLLARSPLLGSTYFRLDGAPSQVFSSDHLPQSPLDLFLFVLPEFSMSLLGPTIPPSMYPPEMHLSGRIDAFYAIPEPSCGLLFMSASLLMRRGD